jgi:WhiB family transcriptional regulator, redox-sensing transcriptional regulator
MSATYEAMMSALSGIPPLPSAACRQHPPQLFDAETDEDAFAASAICAACPAKLPCGRFAGSLKPTQRHGVWAGRRYEWTPYLRQSKAVAS